MKDDALHWHVLVTLWACAIAGWIAAAEPPPNEPAQPAPAVAAAPYESPYPAPRVDPSAPPQEAAPTF